MRNMQMTAMPDFARLITADILKDRCKGNEQACSFPYKGYTIVANKCEDRNLWEVRIHRHQTGIMSLTVPITRSWGGLAMEFLLIVLSFF